MAHSIKVIVNAHFIDAGVVGNYGDARIIVRQSQTGLLTGIYLNNVFVFTTNQPTLNLTQGVTVSVSIAWSTRLLFAEVVSAGIAPNPGSR